MPVITTEEEFDKALVAIQNESIIAIDTETTKTEIWNDRSLMGVSVWCPSISEGFYFNCGHNSTIKAMSVDSSILFSILLRNQCWVFHNAKFDLQVLQRAGLAQLPEMFYDTMIMSWLVDEEPPHGLKELAVKLISPTANSEQKQVKKLERLVGWDNIPADIMGIYAIKDVELTWQLYEHFLPYFENKESETNEMHEVLLRELSFLLVLMDIERRGVRFDRDQAHQFAVAAQSRMRQIEKSLGFDPMKPSQLASKLFGPPPDGLSLIPRSYSDKPSKSFPNGRPDTSESALSSYKGEGEEVCSLVLEYRGLSKAKSTWYEGWSKLGPDGVLHPSYSQHGTVTGRLSCSKPNMQQVPREAGDAPVKALLRASMGHDLVEFDYSQVEFRLAAVYSGDEELLERLRNGSDFHQATADMLRISRQSAKTVNFCILYGGGAGKLSQTLGIPFGDAKTFLANYKQTYPGFDRISEQVSFAMQAKGWIRYWSGRRRHMKRQWEMHKAFNSLIQGGAADIMKFTMLKLSDENLPIRIVGQVHDSLWIEVPSDQPALIPKIKEIMEWPGSEFGIPFPVDMKVLYKNPN